MQADCNNNPSIKKVSVTNRMFYRLIVDVGFLFQHKERWSKLGLFLRNGILSRHQTRYLKVDAQQTRKIDLGYQQYPF